MRQGNTERSPGLNRVEQVGRRQVEAYEAMAQEAGAAYAVPEDLPP